MDGTTAADERSLLASLRAGDDAAFESLLPRFGPGGHRTGPAAWSEDRLEGLEREEIRAMVAEGIDRLPDDHRIVLVLRDIEGHSTQETAETVGISPAAVKTRLHRARQALRTILERTLAP